jgi:hypothetical protein
MIKFSRIALALVSCISLSVLGTASAASAHPRHAAPTHHVVKHVHAPKRVMKTADKDWCC